mmetsp:Transcript_4302/g.10099  ORF Transcript_4302/g.10099 Transcript_4302/m.10099 type:complete len:522 (+) Transcript_4302:204-1769(+)
MTSDNRSSTSKRQPQRGMITDHQQHSSSSSSATKKRRPSFFKMNYEEDTRRVPMSAVGGKTFSELGKLIRTMFDRDPEAVLVKYRDDEEELVNISTSEELHEAFRVLENEGKTLKLFVEDKTTKSCMRKSGIMHGTDRKSDRRSSDCPTPVTDNKTTKSCMWKSGIMHGTDRKSDRKPSDCPTPVTDNDEPGQSASSDTGKGRKGGGKKDEYRRNHGDDDESLKESVKESVRMFLSDQKVVQAIQAAVPLMISGLLEGKGFQNTLDAAIKSQETLREHPFLKTALPHLQNFLGLFPPQVCMLQLFLELVPKFNKLFYGKKPCQGLQLFRKIICAVRTTGKEIFFDKARCGSQRGVLNGEECKALSSNCRPFVPYGRQGPMCISPFQRHQPCMPYQSLACPIGVQGPECIPTHRQFEYNFGGRRHRGGGHRLGGGGHHLGGRGGRGGRRGMVNRVQTRRSNPQQSQQYGTTAGLLYEKELQTLKNILREEGTASYSDDYLRNSLDAAKGNIGLVLHWMNKGS